MGHEHRAKIANSKILNRLIAHAEGVEDMRQSEVTAALALLKKIMPDLSAQTIEHSGPDGDPIEIASGSLSDLEVARRLAFLLRKPTEG